MLDCIAAPPSFVVNKIGVEFVVSFVGGVSSCTICLKDGVVVGWFSSNPDTNVVSITRNTSIHNDIENVPFLGDRGFHFGFVHRKVRVVVTILPGRINICEKKTSSAKDIPDKHENF